MLSSLLFAVFKLIQENTQPQNMCDIVFKVTASRGGAMSRAGIYAETAVRRVFWKGCYEKFHRIHKKTSVLVSLFLMKLRADSRSDDLTIFKCSRVIFSLKDKAIQFSLSFNL